jgi:hypothetical protein
MIHNLIIFVKFVEIKSNPKLYNFIFNKKTKQMHLSKYLLLLAAVLLLCSDYYPFSGYIPVLMERNEMERAVKLEPARPMIEPGKIYYKNPYLFIVEKYKGVHVIDNSNPVNPEKIGFIHIDGIRDIAIKDNVMYADNAVDLIAVQLNDSYTSVSVSKRLRNYFPEMISPDGIGSQSYNYKNRSANSIIVAWKTNNSNQ